MSILDIFLKKKGVKGPEELDNTPNTDGSPTEKQDYERIKAILSKEDLNTEDIKKFCQSQISIIEAKWSDFNLSQERKSEMIPYHTVYSIIIKAINAPQAEREQLENHLNQLTK